MAAGLVAVLPAISFWALDGLATRSSAIEVGLRPEAIARHFAPEDATASRSSTSRLVVGTSVAADSAPPSPPVKATVPPLRGLEAALTPPPAAVAVTAIRPSLLGTFWQNPELVGALALYMAVAGMALALILSVARTQKSSSGLVPRAASPQDVPNDASGVHGPVRSNESLTRDLRCLAEQVRLDVADTVHDMRSPLGTVIGSLDMLRREIPRADARAQRALQLADKATERLVALVDGSWRTGNALATLFLAPRRRVDIGCVLLALTGNRVSHHGLEIQPRVTAACPVSAPEGALDLAIDSLFQHLRDELPIHATLFASVACSGEEVLLEIQTSAAAVLDWDTDRLVPRDTARTISLLGGRLEASVLDGDAGSIRIFLPRG